MTNKPKFHADGIYLDLSFEDYLADPAMSASSICDLLTSPATYWANSHMNPNKAPREETDATKMGTYIHAALLEPGEYDFVSKPAGMSFATKEGKAWKADMLSANATILTPKEVLTLKGCRLTWEASGVADAMRDGLAEVSFFWTDKSGHRCKIRIDWLMPFGAADIKTYVNSQNKPLDVLIGHTVANYRYHIKGYWYHLGIEELRKVIMNGEDGKIFGIDALKKRLMEGWAGKHLDLEHHFPMYYIFMEKDGVPNCTIKEFTERYGGEVNEYWKAAKASVVDATNDYAKYMKEFGSDKPWIRRAKFDIFIDNDFAAAPWLYRD